MKYQFRSRSYPYDRRQPLSKAIIVSEILGVICLVVLLAALIGIAGILYQPVGV